MVCAEFGAYSALREQPRTGRDSIAQAQRSGALGGCWEYVAKAPAGRDSPPARHFCLRNLGPLGLPRHLCRDPGLRRLGRLRPGLSNLAPFGLFVERTWSSPTRNAGNGVEVEDAATRAAPVLDRMTGDLSYNITSPNQRLGGARGNEKHAIFWGAAREVQRAGR